jgi:hypothetical protein
VTVFVQSLPTFDQVVAVGCFKDAIVVEGIKRRRRHGDREIYRDFVILPEGVQDKDLPRDLFSRTRLRSHLRADPDRLVEFSGAAVVLGPELRSVQESLQVKGLRLSNVVPMQCSYIRDGVQFNCLVIRITRPY